jgi:hypothetical protein
VGWVYLDDHFDEHPKVLAAGEVHPLAPWLYVCGLTYCRRNESPGLIPPSKVRTLTPLFKPAAVQALFDVKLWVPSVGDAVEVHDYGEWNRHNGSRSASARNAARVRWEREKGMRS